MSELLALGGNGIPVREAARDARFSRIRARTALLAKERVGAGAFAADVAEHAHVDGLGERGLERNALLLQVRMKAHGAEPDGAFALGGVFRARNGVGSVVDKVLQDVVKKMPWHPE